MDRAVTFRLPEDLLLRMDIKLRILNYAHRSELLRELIRDWVEKTSVEVMFVNDRGR